MTKLWTKRLIAAGALAGAMAVAGCEKSKTEPNVGNAMESLGNSANKNRGSEAPGTGGSGDARRAENAPQQQQQQQAPASRY